MTSRGETTYGNQDTYVGEYRNGLKWGMGTYTWANGSSYTGQWVSDRLHGKGVWIDTNQVKWIGEWRNDYIVGMTLKVYPEQVCYGTNQITTTMTHRRQFRDRNGFLVHEQAAYQHPRLWTIWNKRVLDDTDIVCEIE